MTDNTTAKTIYDIIYSTTYSSVDRTYDSTVPDEYADVEDELKINRYGFSTNEKALRKIAELLDKYNNRKIVINISVDVDISNLRIINEEILPPMSEQEYTIRLIHSQTKKTRKEIISALKKHNDDVVDTIVALNNINDDSTTE